MKDLFSEIQKKQSEARSKGLCTNCLKHKHNGIPWVGDGGVMGFVHGAYTYWCDCCVLKEQIKHAEEQVKRLRELRQKYNKLNCDGGVS